MRSVMLCPRWQWTSRMAKTGDSRLHGRSSPQARQFPRPVANGMGDPCLGANGLLQGVELDPSGCVGQATSRYRFGSAGEWAIVMPSDVERVPLSNNVASLAPGASFRVRIGLGRRRTERELACD